MNKILFNLKLRWKLRKLRTSCTCKDMECKWCIDLYSYTTWADMTDNKYWIKIREFINE